LNKTLRMKFSIRDLMALVLLLALGLLAWRTSNEAKRANAQSEQLGNEIESLEAVLRLDDPAIHQAILHTTDEFESLDQMRERSLAHFESLREKHSAMMPRSADVLSLRSIPSLPDDGASAPVIFRLLVPEARPAWLKFGVHMTRPTAHSSKALDDHPGFRSESLLGVSGPFEAPLPPGDHTITIAMGAAHEGAVPVVIALHDKTLLQSSFASSDGVGFSNISARSQIDFRPNQELPWLLTAEMNRDQTGTDESQVFSVWLSDRPSNFKGFPGE
jgi:hypothetical protein